LSSLVAWFHTATSDELQPPSWLQFHGISTWFDEKIKNERRKIHHSFSFFLQVLFKEKKVSPDPPLFHEEREKPSHPFGVE